MNKTRNTTASYIHLAFIDQRGRIEAIPEIGLHDHMSGLGAKIDSTCTDQRPAPRREKKVIEKFLVISDSIFFFLSTQLPPLIVKMAKLKKKGMN